MYLAMYFQGYRLDSIDKNHLSWSIEEQSRKNRVFTFMDEGKGLFVIVEMFWVLRER